MESGYIKSLVLDKGYGFIAVAGLPDIFFNVKDVDRELDWDEQLRERRVKFSTISTGRGPKAVGIVGAD